MSTDRPNAEISGTVPPGYAEHNARATSKRVFPPAPQPLPSPVTDNHTHLSFRPEFAELDLAQALDAAEAVGVHQVVQVGFDMPSSRFTYEAVSTDPRVLGAVAIHPNDSALAKADGSFDDMFAEIVRLSTHERIRAIGETGLDYFRTGEDLRAGQREAFAQHIALAKERSLALMIHDRDAHSDVVDTLLRVGAPERVVFHCYSGDEDLARICNQHGWYMSFAGTVTFGNAAGVQRSCQIADPKLRLVETDAPFLTPMPDRGKVNASYLTPTTVRFMAELTGTDLQEMCEQLERNTQAVYGSWSTT